jgi:MFS family permease
MDKRPVSRLKRDLGAIMADGASFSVMVGLGETYLAAFVLALGLGERAAGLIAAAPMLAGAVLQMAAPWAVQKLGSRRRWVVACAALQAASLLMVAAIALSGGPGRWLVFVAATLYWGTGMATGPAWNVWVAQIVPSYLRPTFFARRARVGHIGVLVGFVAGGAALQFGQQSGTALIVFAAIFAVAGGFRFFSAAMLALQSEPQPAENRETWRMRDLTARRGGEAFWRVLMYLLFVQFAVHLASPFFTPFMISHLGLSYAGYASLIALAFCGKIAAMHWLGDLASRLGPQRLLWIAGLAITPLSGLWFFSQSFAYLAVLQIAGGFAWAAYELAMLLVFFEAIPAHRRTAVLTLYNLGNAVAIAVGAFAGAAILGMFGETRGVYLMLFVLSSAARLASLAILPRAPQQAPATAPITRTLAVRPEGSLERPVLAGRAEEAPSPAVSVAAAREDAAEVVPAIAETSA